MKDKQQFHGKTVFVAGGSSGLGKEIAKALATRGAHITIFARRQGPLDEARNEIVAARRDVNGQEVHAVSLDLGNPTELDAIFRSQARIPDILYCVAGGTSSEIGFFSEIDVGKIESCMRNNYFTAAYAAHSVLRIWTDDDDKKKASRRSNSSPPKLRQIIFINSAAAFLGLPGYAGYTSSKCALRGLADTLRMEALRLSGPASTYTIHCAFPSNFISPAFLEEQKIKPALTKRMEGTTGSMAELERKFPSAEEVAQKIIAGVERGDDFALCDDSIESSLLFANMIGPSPKRGLLGVRDSLLATVVGLLVWPVLRRRWDKMCKQDGMHNRSMTIGQVG